MKEPTIPTDRPSQLEVWTDPGCPWAWQTVGWLIDLRDRGVVDIEWHLFSLEVNSSEPDAPFWDENRRFGAAHTSLLLAQREDPAAFERLYLALGRRLHEKREEMSPDTLAAAIDDAGLGNDLVERAAADPSLVHDVLELHRQARERSVFGVPTLTIDGSKPIYGPLIPLAPEGEDALAWWEHVRWIATRPDFFELKRWPRDIKPGQSADDPPR
jgi:predicted DsbA family dithiol-disulfide isomerase